MNFSLIILSLKKTPILPEFYYEIAAWLCFGKTPTNLFVKACLIDNFQAWFGYGRKPEDTYTEQHFQDVQNWLKVNAPFGSIGADCLDRWSVKMKEEAEEKLRLYAEQQHRN